MKNRFVIILGVIFFIGLFSISIFYYKESYAVIGLILAAGLFFGIMGSLFMGFINPPKWLFRFRFIIYEIGFGIMIGLITSFSISLKNQTFIMNNLIKYLIVASILAIIWGSSKSYLKFRRLIKKTFNTADNKSIISDSATFKGSEGQIILGQLLLTSDRLIFYSAKSNECLFDSNLEEIIPTVERSKFLKIPRGLNLLPSQTKVHVRFPYYWLKVIEQEKKTPDSKH
jgi:hypothetical protein